MKIDEICSSRRSHHGHWRYSIGLSMHHFRPMRLLRIPEPFDHPDWLYEVKFDGFRALAHVTGHQCQLVSRNGHRFKSWPYLAEEIAHAVRAHSAVLDGEICCFEPDGTRRPLQPATSSWKHLSCRCPAWLYPTLTVDSGDIRSLWHNSSLRRSEVRRVGYESLKTGVMLAVRRP
jgi:hypothetical protein